MTPAKQALRMSGHAETISSGSVWEARYRVLGQSAVWHDMYVCEILSGPDKGRKVVLGGEQFSGERTTEGVFSSALAPARRRRKGDT